MRNILLFIDNVTEADGLAKKALKVARQCKANLLLCSAIKTHAGSKLLFHDHDNDILLEENDEIDIKGLALRLKNTAHPQGSFVPAIESVEINEFNHRIVGEMVIKHHIWLMIMGEQQLNQLKIADSENYALKVINNINCPVLLIPQHIELSYFNRIAYVTDLRYCDLGVIKFLKVFNAQLFVTHVSAPGLPDMEERYAQEILAEEISMKANYQKMFLRNIKNKNVPASVDHVVNTLEIKMLALVNKKHQTFERLFDKFPETSKVYHNITTLIFPYLNWFNQASFYI